MKRTARHVLVELAPGGLLLDLASGSLLKLNETATIVWRRHLNGEDSGAIAEGLVARYSISPEIARQDVLGALADRPSECPPIETEFRYERSDGGYVFSRRGKPLFVTDNEGRGLSRARPAEFMTTEEARQYLRGVAPKILALRGQTVLHASTVVLAGNVVAFSGASGAGKTTAARALVSAGAAPAGEDKLVVRLETDGVVGLVNGETAIHAWADCEAALVADGRTISCSGLDAATEGRSLPFFEVGFVDVARRAPGPIRARRLPVLDAAAALFNNGFYGSDATDEWIRRLQGSAAIAGFVAAFELTLPDDLAALAVALGGVERRGSLAG